MKLKLSHKLFIANLGIIFALVLIMLGISYVFSKNLLNDLMHAHISKDLKSFSSVLSKEYERENSWDGLIKNRNLWASIIRSYIQDTDDLPNHPLKPDSQIPLKLVPVKIDSLNDMHSERFDIFIDRVSLLDNSKNPIISASILGHSYKYQKISVRNEVVGWLVLGLPSFNKISNTNNYLEQQLKVSLWLGAVGIFIAAFFSFGLSRQITAPIKKLTQGAKQLAERDFSLRISINTNDEFSELANSFNHISDELSNYDRKQKQWLMDISHELRTPLTILQGEFSAIGDGVTQYSPYIISSLQDEVSHINRLINDLNDLFVTESLGFHCLKDEIDPSKLLSDNLNRYKSKLLGRNISLHTSLDVDNIWVMGDANRLSQVLGNLLENSFRYIQSPGRLWVSAEVKDDQVIITFNDSGPGVPAQAIEQLFDRLYRIENSRNRKTGGAGLGLAICKNIITAHSGEIHAFNNTKGGLCITITLPVK